MSALYAVRDLSVSLPGQGFLGRLLPGRLLPGAPARIDILQGITLALAAGETFALVGESGSGKTTLARAMLGLVPVSGGSLHFDGVALGSARAFAGLRRSTAMMFQDPVGSLSPRMTVGALLAEPFVIHRRPLPLPGRAGRAAQAAALLDRVGLPARLAARYPHELSGGQARRVCVARAIALDPRLVIADEPTAGLDVSVQGEILNLMTGLGTALGIGFLVITHNLAMVRHIADRIAVLYLGRLVESGPAAAVLARPAHPYTQSLIASEPQPDPRRRRADLAIRGEIPGILRRPAGCAFHGRCPRAEAICRVTEPDLRDLGAGQQAACHFAPGQ
ncbi:MAG: peptide ABC transporter ATP-binding protein [Alphaproteobacteria bacterium HGW-Alphaproteobacteria-6]|nr:MAG: peptide ABC transporter ATP-binding protein [Alphaproteobacteria bacterium HGW-Alphaproteobacteria-6]